jgi:sugar/nucleoside kinase (ribokinase family)
MESPTYLLVGDLRRDFLLTPDGAARLDVPGGSLLYAAVGLALWEESIGLVARVGEDYPREWLREIEQRGWDIRGIRILPQALDVRRFLAYSEGGQLQRGDPVAQFANRGLNFPKTLLGYRFPDEYLDSRTELTQRTVRVADIPEPYQDCRTAHICPADFKTHSLLPAVIRGKGCPTVTVDPGRGYMNPTFWGDLPGLVSGLTAFLPGEAEIRALFHGRCDDLWEMAEALGAFGCESVVIKCGWQGQLLYDVVGKRRWEIPAYPSRVKDPTGVGDAFCGGFLAGFRQTYDPLQAVLRGNVSASIVIEGSGVFYSLDVLPGLAQARLEVLQDAVRRV